MAKLDANIAQDGLVRKKHKDVASQLKHLGDLSRPELVELWQKQFKCPPPKGVKRGFLERAAAYQIQSKRYGGLKANTRKQLLRIAANEMNDVSYHDLSGVGDPLDDNKFDGNSRQKVRVRGLVIRPALTAGTKLIREWHGKSHQVEVLEDGFDWRGKRYSSLSAIAKAITGTKWSGPRFFGIRS